MQKIITLKHSDICWECATLLPKNTMVMWLGTKKGIYCFPSCWFKHKGNNCTNSNSSGLTKDTIVNTIEENL